MVGLWLPWTQDIGVTSVLEFSTTAKSGRAPCWKPVADSWLRNRIVVVRSFCRNRSRDAPDPTCARERME